MKKGAFLDKHCRFKKQLIEEFQRQESILTNEYGFSKLAYDEKGFPIIPSEQEFLHQCNHNYKIEKHKFNKSHYHEFVHALETKSGITVASGRVCFIIVYIHYWEIFYRYGRIPKPERDRIQQETFNLNMDWLSIAGNIIGQVLESNGEIKT